MNHSIVWRGITGVVALVLTGGLAYTSVQMIELSRQVDDLNARVAKTKPAAGPRVLTQGRGADEPGAGLEGAEDRLLRLERELQALKDSGKKAAEEKPAKTDGKPGEAEAPIDGKAALAEMDEKTRAAIKEAAKQTLQEEFNRFTQRMGTGMVDGMMSSMTKELGLNEYQQTEIRKIFDNTAKAMSDLWVGDAGKGLSMDERRTKMTEITQNANTQVKSQLTADQSVKYDDWQQTQGRGFGGMMGGGGRRRVE